MIPETCPSHTNTFQSLASLSHQSSEIVLKAKKTVLVVEDDKTHRTMMKKILEENGFRVMLAENGVVALSQLEMRHKINLVIMDWDMPELNGLDTVREIRKSELENGFAHMPVIGFTSNRAPGDQEQCLAAGMDAYLPKDVWMPHWHDALIENLENLMSGNESPPAYTDNDNVPDLNVKLHHDLDAFDEDALAQTVELLKDEFGIMIEEYLEDAAAYIAEIEAGYESNDAQKVAGASHPLKSNSRGLGLVAVADIAEAMNTAARNDDLEVSAVLASQLRDAFMRAEKRLRNLIQRNGY